MPSACLRKSAYSASNCSEVIDWLPAHHMFLSVLASRTVNLSFGLRPVKTPVSAHKAPSAESTASPAANEYSQSCGAPKFQLTPLSFFKPNLSAPKAPLCTPVSCTEESSSNPRISSAHAAKRAAVAVTFYIACRPRSGDLLLMNPGLAKPIPSYLVYSGRESLMRLKHLLQRDAPHG